MAGVSEFAYQFAALDLLGPGGSDGVVVSSQGCSTDRCLMRWGAYVCGRPGFLDACCSGWLLDGGTHQRLAALGCLMYLA